ncbi:MAG: hypothetical protein ABFC38_00990 [Methanospirillum sp.]
MPAPLLAARDAPMAERYRADLVCDGKTDVAVLAKAFEGTFDEVALTAGTAVRFESTRGGGRFRPDPAADAAGRWPSSS